MYRKSVVPAASVVLFAALLGAGCEAAPTAPVATAPDAPVHAGASVIRQDIEFTPPFGIPAPSPCLGGTFLITGTITGWSRTVVTPNGHVHINEHLDFSQLTASFGGRTWTALPGSHEIWSINLPPLGKAARVVVHEGRTRFDADDGEGPRMMFVHRIHQLVLPSGELQMNNVTFEALCLGPGA